MELESVKTILQNCGVVGAGGAGFPSYAKLNEKADTVILNCAECEPLLKLHRQVLKHHTKEILTALDTVRKAVGADRAIIAIKPSAKHTIAACNTCLEELKQISIGLLPEVYPAGDEVIAIYETTGRIVQPGQLPITVGVIVYNVETMLNAYFALTEGKGVDHKYVTVTGAVKEPVTLRLPLGITFREAIDLAGGTTVGDYEVLCGGPMTGHLASEADVVTKTTNAVIVLPSDHPVVLKKHSNPAISFKRAMSACCQCRMCTDLCPRHLLGHPIEPNRFMRSVTNGVTHDTAAYTGAFFCSSCGLCEMYSCFQGLTPRTLLSVMKTELKKGGVPMPPVTANPVNRGRDGRRISKNRLIARLGLAEYNAQALLDEREITPKSVRLLLGQHIGAPAIPAVKVGDKVQAGDLIAKPTENALSVAIHTPLAGTVKEVTEKYIVVAAR